MGFRALALNHTSLEGEGVSAAELAAARDRVLATAAKGLQHDWVSCTRFPFDCESRIHCVRAVGAATPAVPDSAV